MSDRGRSDWIVVLAMAVGTFAPGVCLYFVSTAWWSMILAGVLAFPGSFIGGLLATRGERA